MFRTLVVFAVLSSGSVWAAGHEVLFKKQMKVGTSILKPGSYKVKLQGSVAILVDQDSGKSATIVAKQEPVDPPAASDRAEFTIADGVGHLTEIFLSGEKFKLKFMD